MQETLKIFEKNLNTIRARYCLNLSAFSNLKIEIGNAIIKNISSGDYDTPSHQIFYVCYGRKFYTLCITNLSQITNEIPTKRNINAQN